MTEPTTNPCRSCGQELDADPGERCDACEHRARTEIGEFVVRLTRAVQIDHYAVLGVSPWATSATIRAAHRRLIARHHVDRLGGDDPAALERSVRINVARDILLDPRRRAMFDAARAGGRYRWSGGWRGPWPTWVKAIWFAAGLIWAAVLIKALDQRRKPRDARREWDCDGPTKSRRSA